MTDFRGRRAPPARILARSLFYIGLQSVECLLLGYALQLSVPSDLEAVRAPYADWE